MRWLELITQETHVKPVVRGGVFWFVDVVMKVKMPKDISASFANSIKCQAIFVANRSSPL